MKRKFLEDLGLEKEMIDKILDENSQDIGGVKKQVEELTTANKQLSDDIKSRDTQLNDLKKAGSVEDLQNQIETLQEANKKAKKEYDQEIANMKYNGAIDKAFEDCIHPELLSDKIDRSKLSIDNDKILGLDEQVKTLKDTYKDQVKPSKTGKTPNMEGKTTGEITAEQFSKMKYSEKAKLFTEDKDLYDQLSGGNE